MDTRYFLNSDGELCHWGIKGMKWGVRRYQNKDGSLTPAGEKRRAKLETELEKISPKKSAAEKEAEDIETKKARILQSRSAKEIYDNANLFTYNELNAAKMRLELEANIKKLEPPTVEKGKDYAKQFIDTTNKISDVAQSGAKAYNNMAKIFNGLYGNTHGKSLPLINDSVSSKLDKFKEETDWLKAKNERKKAVEESKEKEKSDLEKLRDETAWIDAENRNREARRASRAHDEKDRREAEKAQKEQAERREQNEQERASRQKQNNTKNDTADDKVYTGEVIGEAKRNSSRNDNKYEDAIDAEFYDITTSNVPAVVTNNGRNYVSGLLEEPKR